MKAAGKTATSDFSETLKRLIDRALVQLACFIKLDLRSPLHHRDFPY